MVNDEGDLPARAAARTGSVLLGKYRLDRVLGIGGMAVVYAATHRNRQTFALKMLHPELSLVPEIRTRFLREGYVANSVPHKGAVKVLDDDVAEDGAAFLVMELLEGEPGDRLAERHGQRLPPAAALALAHQLLDVLAVAHAHAIVHRDIKPANLFLTRDGTIKVLDFGIARLREHADTRSTQGLLGTPLFMGPEQALGRSEEIDGRTDIWSVGATLFSLLSGSVVHAGRTPQEVLVFAATQPARSLATAAPHISPRIVSVVDRALAFRKSDRWNSADQMRDVVRDTYLAEFGADVTADPLLALLEPRRASAPPVAATRPSNVATNSPTLDAPAEASLPGSIPRTPAEAFIPTSTPGTRTDAPATRTQREAAPASPRRFVRVPILLGAATLVGGGLLASRALRPSVVSVAETPPAAPSSAAIPSPPAPTSLAALPAVLTPIDAVGKPSPVDAGTRPTNAPPGDSSPGAATPPPRDKPGGQLAHHPAGPSAPVTASSSPATDSPRPNPLNMGIQ